ncbi:MAG: hypothetical protein C4527_08855 [Candidatus Omnitrophota bacterium]|jgi:hypothetical protein|nr:MAG: hypothetical protein C4527_08855 [Candidatus Omnitrophota bacterium]
MKKRLFHTFVTMTFCILWIPISSASESIPETMEGMPLLFSEDFENGADQWEPTDSNAWKIIAQGGNHVLSLFQQSEYKPPVRSPINYTLIKDLWISDFVFEVKAEQTGKEYGHRDLCFFYHWRDRSHFYYTHIASVADPHANSIFLVNGEPRVSIAKERTDGTQWIDGKYHTIRIVRKVEEGSIKIYFDDMAKPIMIAEDKTFTAGRIGVGSFDDTGNFDNIRLWGVKVEPPKN